MIFINIGFGMLAIILFIMAPAMFAMWIDEEYGIWGMPIFFSLIACEFIVLGWLANYWGIK